MAYKVRNIDLEKRARNLFGITDNPLEAGYITRDGEYLQFSHALGTAGRIERYHVKVMAAMTPE